MTEWNPDHEQLRRMLLAAIRAQCPRWLQDLAEDLTQKAMMTVLRIIAGRETDHPLPASYLRKVAYTTVIDEIRRRRKERYDRSLDEEDSDVQPAANDADPERATTSREISAAVRGCVDRLPASRRRAVTRYLLGQSIPEIARREAWNRKRASNLVYRGLASARRCLEEKGVQP